MFMITTSICTDSGIKANQLNLVISYQHLLICLIGPRGSDKYSPGDLELLLWISMLIGFQLDLTDLASPPERDSLEPVRGLVYLGVSRKRRGREMKKMASGLKKGAYCLVDGVRGVGGKA